MKKIFLISIFGFIWTMGFSQTLIYMNKEGGVYTVPCKVNGLKLKFIFDTGASDVSISLAEAIFMIKNDYLSQTDIYGTTYARIANGEITENTEILLREIEIGGLKLYNIRATVVHELAAPLLLGQSAISKLGAIQLDGNKLTILSKGSNSSYNYENENKSSTDDKQNYYSREVYTCSAIYDKPDMKNGIQIGSACEGKVMIIQKINDNYYKVKTNNIIGYLWKGSLK